MRPPSSNLNYDQVLQHAFNDETGCLRVEIVSAPASEQTIPAQTVNLSEEDRDLLKGLAEDRNQDHLTHVTYLEKRLSYAKNLNIFLACAFFIVAMICFKK